MDDEHMTSAENEQSQSQSQSQSQNKRKARGASKGLKSKTGVVRVLEWDQYYRPVGKWLTDFKTHIGEIARSKVSISYKHWKDVPQGIKNTLWEDCKREFHIEEHEQKKRRVLRTADERWRGFKQILVSGWITCTRKMPADKRPPYELYDFMDVDEWNRFVKEHSTDEFQAISERARKNQSFNEYSHHMEAKSYAEMDAVLIYAFECFN